MPDFGISNVSADLPAFALVVSELIVALALLLPVLVVSADRFFDRRFTKVLFLSIPFIYIVLFLLDYKTGLLPHFPDSEGYRLALEEGLSEPVVKGTYADFYHVNAPVRAIGGGVPMYIVLNSVMFVLGATLTWSAWIRFAEREVTDVHHVTFLLLLSLWPGGVLYNSSLLREGQVVFFWGIALYSAIVLSRFPFWTTGWISVLFGALGLLYLRKELIPAALIFAVLVGVWNSRFDIRKVLLATPILPIPIYFALKVTGYAYLFDPNKLEYLRKVRTTSSELSYMGSVDWNSWLDVAPDVFQLTVLFLTSPLTTISHPLEMFVATVDAVFVICLIGFGGAWGIKSYRSGTTKEIGWLLGFFVLAAGFGLIEYHIGGAARHRMPLVVTLLPIAATAITELGKYKLNAVRITWS